MLLHSRLVGVDQRADGGHRRVLTPGGPIAINAGRVIDASGDAQAAYLLGAPLEEAGTHEAAQTFTTTFRMCNVDLERIPKAGGKNLLQRKMIEAVDTGTYALPRKTGSVHAMVQPNCIATVAVRVPFSAPFDPRAERGGTGRTASGLCLRSLPARRNRRLRGRQNHRHVLATDRHPDRAGSTAPIG